MFDPATSLPERTTPETAESKKPREVPIAPLTCPPTPEKLSQWKEAIAKGRWLCMLNSMRGADSALTAENGSLGLWVQDTPTLLSAPKDKGEVERLQRYSIVFVLGAFQRCMLITAPLSGVINW
jgi:hypothetical protein